MVDNKASKGLRLISYQKKKKIQRINSTKNSKKAYFQFALFEDIRIEQERLVQNAQLITARIDDNFLKIRNAFSVSAFPISLAKEYVMFGLSSYSSL